MSYKVPDAHSMNTQTCFGGTHTFDTIRISFESCYVQIQSAVNHLHIDFETVNYCK